MKFMLNSNDTVLYTSHFVYVYIFGGRILWHFIYFNKFGDFMISLVLIELWCKLSILVSF